MKKFRAFVLVALLVAMASYGLVWGSCVMDPTGSCSILGFNPVPPANQVVVTNGENPDDPPDSGSWPPPF